MFPLRDENPTELVPVVTLVIIAINVLVYGSVVAFIISAVLWFWVPDLLGILGAEGRSLDLSIQYLQIIVPSMFMMTLAMASSGILRATGDPRRAMMATVWGGLVNAALDPFLIFTLEMGIQGAAWASVLGRTVVMLYALNGSIRIHDLVGRFPE